MGKRGRKRKLWNTKRPFKDGGDTNTVKEKVKIKEHKATKVQKDDKCGNNQGSIDHPIVLDSDSEEGQNVNSQQKGSNSNHQSTSNASNICKSRDVLHKEVVMDTSNGKRKKQNDEGSPSRQNWSPVTSSDLFSNISNGCRQFIQFSKLYSKNQIVDGLTTFCNTNNLQESINEVLESNEICVYDGQKVDKISMKILPHQMLEDLMPVVTGDDGNCFYRAVSLNIFGTEDQHFLIRSAILLDVLTNQRSYSKFIYRNKMEHSLEFYIEELKRNKSWAENLMFYACSRILQRPICVYQEFWLMQKDCGNLRELMKDVDHGIHRVYLFDDSYKNKLPICMHYRNVNGETSEQPNHFVALLPRQKLYVPFCCNLDEYADQRLFGALREQFTEPQPSNRSCRRVTTPTRRNVTVPSRLPSYPPRLPVIEEGEIQEFSRIQSAPKSNYIDNIPYTGGNESDYKTMKEVFDDLLRMKLIKDVDGDESDDSDNENDEEYEIEDSTSSSENSSSVEEDDENSSTDSESDNSSTHSENARDMNKKAFNPEKYLTEVKNPNKGNNKIAYKCSWPNCKKKPDINRNGVIKHIEGHENGKDPDPLYDKYYNEFKHLAVKADDKTDANSYYYFCKSCFNKTKGTWNKKRAGKTDVIRHIFRDHAGDVVRTWWYNREVLRKTNAVSKDKRSKKRFKCKKCPATFSNRKARNTHNSSMHNKTTKWYNTSLGFETMIKQRGFKPAVVFKSEDGIDGLEKIELSQEKKSLIVTENEQPWYVYIVVTHKKKLNAKQAKSFFTSLRKQNVKLKYYVGVTRLAGNKISEHHFVPNSTTTLGKRIRKGEYAYLLKKLKFKTHEEARKAESLYIYYGISRKYVTGLIHNKLRFVMMNKQIKDKAWMSRLISLQDWNRVKKMSRLDDNEIFCLDDCKLDKTNEEKIHFSKFVEKGANWFPIRTKIHPDRFVPLPEA